MGQEVHEGWLLKSPPSWKFWNQEWRRKYFVLCSGNMPDECYLKQYSDNTKAKLQREINLQDCQQADAYLTYESKNRKVKYDWIFDLRMAGNHKKSDTIFLVAETRESMVKWVDLICTVCHLERDSGEYDDHEIYHENVRLVESNGSLDEMHTRSPSVDSAGGFAARDANGAWSASATPAVSLNAPVPPSQKTTINMCGGVINSSGKQGYIALKDCISGPPRPSKPAADVNGYSAPPPAVSDDSAPFEAPPPLPAGKSGSVDSTSLDNGVPRSHTHSRDPSNDSTTSSTARASSDSEGVRAPRGGSRNGYNSAASYGDGSGDDRGLSPVGRTPNLTLVPPPPPRPPKNARYPLVSKEPDLHTPYRNEFLAEEDAFPATYDRPAVEKAASSFYDTLPRSSGAVSPTDADSCFASLPRHRSHRDTVSDNVANPGVSPLSLNESSDTDACAAAGSPTGAPFSYENVTLSPPPRRQSAGQQPHSPNGECRPPVDRSLKPTAKVRHHGSSESSNATSPTLPNAPVQIQEQQPHIPPRLPADKRRLTSTAEPAAYDRPSVFVGVLGVSRKESFTRRADGARPSVQARTPGATTTKPVLDKNSRKEPTKMEYVDVDFEASSGAPPAALRHGSVSNGAVDAAAAAPSSASAAKLSYVVINAELTTALQRTKTDQERMYKGGTLDRNGAKARHK